jgi:hypothetical protein
MSERPKRTRPPHRPAKDEALAALNGSRYHLTILTRLIAFEMPQDRVNQFHWHLRAFFWELYAVADVIKSERKNSVEVEKEYLELVQQRWFRDVEVFRNNAHFSFHLVTMAVDVEERTVVGTAISVARRQLMVQTLPEYVNKMAAVVQATFGSS